MARTNAWTISGWAAILLAPIAMPLVLIARLLPGKKTFDRTPEDVVGFISDFLQNAGDEWDWDEFISVDITDPELDVLRQQAVLAGPPWESAELCLILTAARDIVRQRALGVR